MSIASAGLRPSRRSLLLAGALLAPLGLTGCAQDWGWLPWASPPRARVTLSPLTTAAELVPEDPVLREEWALSPLGGRALGLAVHREASLAAELGITTLAGEEPLPVPIDSAASTIAVDGHSDPVRVYTTTVQEGRRSTSMLTSSDLADWTTTDLGTVIDRSIVAVGDGLVASGARAGTVQLWDVSAEGTVQPLAPIPVPEEDWRVTSLARDGEKLLVAISRRSPEQDWTPALLSSVDSGASWSAPASLPDAGQDATIREVLVQAGTFVVLGLHEAGVDWDEERTYRRPVAWTGVPGEELTREEIPLPLWGIENFHQYDGRGALSPDTPLDFVDLSLGLPVLVADGTELMAPVYFADDCRALRRDKDGTWSASKAGRYAQHALFEAVLDETGQLYRVHHQLRASPADSPKDTERLRFAQARDLVIAQDAPAEGISGSFSWEIGYMERSTESIRWATRSDRYLLGVEGERIVAHFEPRLGRVDPSSAAVHHLAGGITVYAGVVPERQEGEEWGFTAMVSIDGGSWEPTTGLPSPENGVWPGTATTLDGVHHLPFAEWVPTDGASGSVLTPTLFTSEDGIAWEEAPAPQIERADEGPGARGGRIGVLTMLGEVMIGIGNLTDEDGVHHPATFVREGEEWRVVPLEDAPRGSGLDGVTTVAGGTIVHGRWGSEAAQWTLSAEGTLERTYLADETASRGRMIDLGGGALLAGGWIDRPATDDRDENELTGIGACLWASLDGGETWDATMIPGQEGRFPAVSLIEEGENVLVLLDDPDLPRGYRITEAGADVISDA